MKNQSKVVVIGSDIDGEEAITIRSAVGFGDMLGFAKYEVSGSGTATWLDQFLAAAIAPIGLVTLAPMPKHDSKIIGDLSLPRLSDARFLIIGLGIPESYHINWFLSHLPDDDSVQVKSLGLDLGGLTIAGPKAREVLRNYNKSNISHCAMRSTVVQKSDFDVTPAIFGRVSDTGDLGYEIWLKPTSLTVLYDDLLMLGTNFDIRQFIARAFNAPRLEKNCGSLGLEYRPVYDPIEVGLDLAICNKTADFICKTAALAERDQCGSKWLISLAVNTIDADFICNEPVSIDRAVVGWLTSCGFAHASKTSVSLAMVPRNLHFALMAELTNFWGKN